MGMYSCPCVFGPGRHGHEYMPMPPVARFRMQRELMLMTTEPTPPTDAHHVPTHYSPATRIGVILFALLLAIALIFLFIHGQRSRHQAEADLAAEIRHSSEEATPVDVVRVHPSPTAVSLSLPGEARSFYE